ncbi:hypothetical protein [Baekduia alba]|uniref:hypothetical protein n=1 Tax=Baekduia alba TaxID=2997333 RepID=UPI0023418FFB|nr:hypothetical protein [Baekduia alba]
MSVPDWTPPPAPDWDQIHAGLKDAIGEAFEAVVEWEWQPVDVSLDEPHPFASERLGRSPAPVRQGWKPRNQTSAVRCGWDEAGRLRVARRFVDGKRDVVPSDDKILTFHFCEAGDHLDVYRMPRPDGTVPEELRTLVRRSVDGGRLCGLTTWWPERFSSQPLWVRECYEYNPDGSVDTVVAQRDLGGDHLGVVRHGEPQRRVIRMEGVRDATGGLISLHRQEFSESGEPSTGRELLWQRTDADELRAAEQVIVEQLPEAIRAWVERSAPDEPAYCLCVLYGSTWGPSLGIGTTAELQGWGEASASDRMDRMWNPAEFRCFDPEPMELNTGALADAYRVTARSWGSRTPEKIRAACLSVARYLRELTLPLSSAKSFVVYATDLELVDLDANFRKLGATGVRRVIEK